jgi:hypothetical protein
MIMIVQWCCKGVKDLESAVVREILAGGAGLVCRLWQTRGRLPLKEATSRLTEYHLDLHVNHYEDKEPATGLKVRDVTPFLSLSAGCVQRIVLLETNVLHPARRTALRFATDWGQEPGWVFTCYVLVSVNRAVAIRSVAEEIRELHHNRRYSPHHWEGEIVAKFNVPSSQILCAERWTPLSATDRRVRLTHLYINRRFTHPSVLLDERRML